MSILNSLLSFNDKTNQTGCAPSDQNIEITHDEDDHEREDTYRSNNEDPDDDNNV